MNGTVCSSCRSSSACPTSSATRRALTMTAR